MNTNRYIQDYLLTERQQERLREAEQQREAAQATKASPSNGLRHIIGRSGSLLVALGTRLERVEQVKRENTLVSRGAVVSGRLH